MGQGLPTGIFWGRGGAGSKGGRGAGAEGGCTAGAAGGWRLVEDHAGGAAGGWRKSLVEGGAAAGSWRLVEDGAGAVAAGRSLSFAVFRNSTILSSSWLRGLCCPLEMPSRQVEGGGEREGEMEDKEEGEGEGERWRGEHRVRPD